MASTIFFLALHFLIICSTFLPSESHSINEGFTISLVHRDSPQSPLYNKSMNPYESRIASVHRSILHAKRLSLLASSASATSHTNALDISTNLIFEEGEYIASYYIGNPPIKVYAFLDTGSDVIWTKGPPIFNPSKSTTYTELPCNSSSCQILPYKTCRNGPCNYQIQYEDGATTSGVFSRDRFAFDGTGKRLQEVGFLNFGCNNVSSSHFTGKDNGCLGLNRDKVSFLTQLGIKKFSHCWDMQNSDGSMLMYFGDKRAKIYPNDLTPLVVAKQPYYYVQLEGISIDEKEVPFPHGVFDITPSGGGFILDCGTTYTLLTEKAYEPFLRMMSQHVQKPVVKVPNSHFELCYSGTSKDLDSIPQVTFRFSRGVKVKLMKEVTFVEYARGIWCLAIIRTSTIESLMGSFQMRNYWVGYDLQTNGVSFTYQQRCPPKAN